MKRRPILNNRVLCLSKFNAIRRSRNNRNKFFLKKKSIYVFDLNAVNIAFVFQHAI